MNKGLLIFVSAFSLLITGCNQSSDKATSNELELAKIELAKAEVELEKTKLETEAAKAKASLQTNKEEQALNVETKGAQEIGMSIKPTETLVNGGTYRYNGTVAGVKVVFTLTNNGGSVNGSYHYSKNARGGDRLMLNGSLSNGYLSLDVYNIDEGETTGDYSLRVQGSKIVGTHTNYNSGKTSKVYLRQI